MLLALVDGTGAACGGSMAASLALPLFEEVGDSVTERDDEGLLLLTTLAVGLGVSMNSLGDTERVADCEMEGALLRLSEGTAEF